MTRQKQTAIAHPGTQPGVIPFDLAERRKQIANEKAVRAALAEFARLVEPGRCRWVSLSGILTDGQHFIVSSHDNRSGEIRLDVCYSEGRK